MKVQPDGYAIILSVLTEQQVVELKAKIQQLVDNDSAYGIGQIERQIPAISRLAYLPSIIKHLNYSDRQLKLVRGIYQKALSSKIEGLGLLPNVASSRSR